MTAPSLKDELDRFVDQVLVEFGEDDFERQVARAAFYRGAVAALAVIAQEDRDRYIRLRADEFIRIPKDIIQSVCDEIAAAADRHRAAASDELQT